MQMKVGVTKEIYPGECRVAATPETARRLIEKTWALRFWWSPKRVPAPAFPDELYEAVGCAIAERCVDHLERRGHRSQGPRAPPTRKSSSCARARR